MYYSYRYNPDEEKELTVYNIPEANMARLEAKIAEMNEKAATLGSEPIILSVVGELTKTHKDPEGDWDEIVYQVTVEGSPPKMAGWELVAVVTPQPSGENLIKCVPGNTCPSQYRNADPGHCDHCNTRRKRRDVFILHNEDDSYTQVGRQCLRDFLGHQDPSRVVRMAEILWSIDELMEEAEGGGWGGGYRAPEFGLQEFIETSACCIRRLGWVPRSRSGEGNPPTSSCVLELLVPPFGAQAARLRKLWIENNQLYVNDKDRELAEAAIAWGAALPTDSGDYLYNLGVAVRNGVVLAGSKNSTVGLLASLVSAYQRQVQRERDVAVREERIREQRASSQHVGSIGERRGFSGLIVRAMREFPGDYGVRTMIRFEDPDGNILVWWKSGESDEWADDSLENATPVDITGTVKTHDEYKGVAQTVLSRVKEGIKAAKPKRTKKPGGSSKGARKCGNCGETGHNKRTCPTKSRKLRRRNRV